LADANFDEAQFLAGARGAFAVPDLQAMTERYTFTLQEVRRTGDDLRLLYTRS